MKSIGVISDTHGLLRPQALSALQGSDLIIHAGDVGDPAILAALVVSEAFASGRSLVLDARVAGLAAGVIAILVRAPLWVVVIVGAAATALVRLLS